MICLASAYRRMRKPHCGEGFFLVVLFSLLGPDFPDKSDIIKIEKEGFSPLRGGVLVRRTTYNPIKAYRECYNISGGINGGRVRRFGRYEYNISGGIEVQQIY